MYEDFEIEKIIEPALNWYAENKRELPWRHGKNAYHTWVSEIMLQQTRVEAVKPYYERFLAALPAIPDLAECPEDELMKLWEGLGYYSRVRNLQKAAKVICGEYGGNMPETYDEIIRLPGIGAYTAGAVSSIAFGEAQPAVDGNVLRILARLCEDDIDIKTELAKKRAYALLKPVMPEGEDAGNFNQALMDIGATICIPNGKPLCEQCPWEKICFCRLHDKMSGEQETASDPQEGQQQKASPENFWEKYPVRSKGKPRRIEERTVILLHVKDGVMIAKRPDKGLLAGLYEFPNLTGHLSENEVRQWVKDMGFRPKKITRLSDAKHIFSHVEWRMRGYEVNADMPESYEERTDELNVYDLMLQESVNYPGSGRKNGRSRKPVVFFAAPEEISEKYAVPSAFEAYTNTLRLS